MGIESMIHKIQINSGYQDSVNFAINNLKIVINNAKDKNIYDKSTTIRSADIAVDHIEKLRQAVDIAVALIDMLHNPVFTPSDMEMGIKAFNTACIQAKVSRLESGKN